MSEHWRAVIGYEGWYEVSDQGRVRRVRCGRGTEVGIRKISPQRDGYRVISLYKNSQGRRYRAARLVAEAFLGPPPSLLHEVNHKNLDRADDRVGNLEWVTRAENAIHAYWANPAAHYSRLTPQEAAFIRVSKEAGVALATRFGVSQGLISMIRSNRVWRDAEKITSH